jgi:eukaryotic-like serine/threonine-protein kinase
MTARYDIFVSYSTTDRDVTEPLVARLREDGYRVWFDDAEMVGGKPMLGQVSDGLRDSNYMIACLSDAYLGGGWPISELNISLSADPANLGGRTRPVWIRRGTLLPPDFVRPLYICDLSGPDRFEAEYAKLTTDLLRVRDQREPAGGQADGPAEETVAQACDRALSAVDDPNLTMFLLGSATELLLVFLHRRHFGEPPPAGTLDWVLERLMRSAALPPEAYAPLALLHEYRRQTVRGGLYEFAVTVETVAPALTALHALSQVFFGDRSRHSAGEDLWVMLPHGDHTTERRIPGTGYFVRELLGRNSLGPLYAGRDADQNELTVNFVLLPESADDRFFEEVARFTRLRAVGIVTPLAAGRIMVDGERRGLYMILPSLDGTSARDLLEHHGPLPERAAYELCADVARALIGFHQAVPPVVHGDIKPANIMLDGFGRAAVLCIGRQVASAATQNADGRIDSYFFADRDKRSGRPLTPQTDLHALHSVLRYLLTGRYPTATGAVEPDGTVRSNGTGRAAAILNELAGCYTALDALRLLRAADAGADGAEGLASVVRRYRHPHGTPERVSTPTGGVLDLVDSCPVDAHTAWPLTAERVLVWERGSDTLCVVAGTTLHWRDTTPIAVRRVAHAVDQRLAVGGWEGEVRVFADGESTISTRLDGAVGDLRFTETSLVAGSWKRSLRYLTAEGTIEHLVTGERGVHRIAVAGRTERFTVVDQSGSLAAYVGTRRVSTEPARDPVRDIAYAGARLVILTDDALTGVRVDGSRSAPVDHPGAFQLLPAPVAGCCVLVSMAGASDGPVTAQGWLIDEEERLLPYFTLTPGDALLSMSAGAKRFTVSRSAGGCAYWRGGAEVFAWPDAVSATVSEDGRRIAVCRPGRVELYEDAV